MPEVLSMMMPLEPPADTNPVVELLGKELYTSKL
jgi:hypothetical protein